MDIGLFAIGLLLLAVAYAVGVKQMTWLIAGFNEKAVKDKKSLAKIAGFGFFLPMGGLLVLMSILEVENETHIELVAMVVLILIAYVGINRLMRSESHQG